MEVAKVALTAAFKFGWIADAFAQGEGAGAGGSGAGGGGNSPAAKSAQGAASSQSFANPGAPANDAKERGGSGMTGTAKSQRHHRRHKTM